MTRPIKFRAWDGGKYEIGSDGSVWSTDFNHTGKRKQMRLYHDRDGYSVVYFNINGVRRIQAVRRLVALTFLGARPEGMQINHKNGIRHDDRVENLEYITPQANTLHGWRSNGRKPSKKMIENGRKQFGGKNNPKAKMLIYLLENKLITL